MPEAEEPQTFSHGQRRFLAFAITFFALVASALLMGLILMGMGRLIGFFSEVLWPLAVAGVAAMILRPLVDSLEYRLKGKRPLAVVILYVLFMGALAGLLISIIPPLVGQILDLIAFAPQFWANASVYVENHYPSWMEQFTRLRENKLFEDLIKSLQEQLGTVPGMVIPSLKAISAGALTVFAVGAQVIIIPVYLFFFLLARGDPTRNLPDHLAFLQPNIRDDVVFLVREFVSIIVTFFRGQILIGLIMGALYAAGFTLVGLKFGLLLGLLVGMLNIIPYLGTIVGLILCLPLAFFQPDGGGLGLAISVAVVKIVVQNIEGWFLTPKIMGDRTGLHPVVIIVAIFFWGTAFNGILGMILAIPLTAFFVTAWRWVRLRYLSVPVRAVT